jgi:hypothetical protein
MPGVTMHAYDQSTWEAEARDQVLLFLLNKFNMPGLYEKTLSQKKL